MAYGNGYQGGAYRPQPPNYIPIPQIRPVSSIEEVRASPIEFDGSVFYFTDVANRKIYTKQIGLDGSPIINLYEQKEIKQAVPQNDNYVTKEEFETVINQLIAKLPKEEQKNSAFDF